MLAIETSSSRRIGFACAIGAHTLWGLFPLYWRYLRHMDSVELVGHRILWSFVLLLVLVPCLLSAKQLGGWPKFRKALTNPRYWMVYTLAGAMIAINWLAFVYAVTNDRILDASLGYYINPLLNVLLGVAVLGERLGWQQWVAILLAAIGVGVMTVAGGGLPWPAVAMATSFAVYGLIKKKAPLPALAGLLLETSVLVLPTLVYLSWLHSDGQGAFVSGTTTTRLLMLGGGVVTVVPLTLFALATQRVALSTIGVLQYIGPTLQLIVGAVVAGEPFGKWRIVGFAFVWCGILLFLIKLRADNAVRRALAQEAA